MKLSDKRLKNIIALFLIGACHVFTFVAVYYCRLNKVAICGADSILFAIPSVVAMIAYAVIFAKIIKIRNPSLRYILVIIASIGICLVSLTVGMAIAFDLWGT